MLEASFGEEYKVYRTIPGGCFRLYIKITASSIRMPTQCIGNYLLLQGKSLITAEQNH